MELNIHDIIELQQVESLLKRYRDLPDWAVQSLREIPYLVVRRGIMNENAIPVGIRGKNRGERIGIEINSNDCKRIIKPRNLVKENSYRFLLTPELYQSLEKIKEYLDFKKVIWGIGGSIGFSLSSKQIVYKDTSDIDLILYPIINSLNITKLWAKEVVDFLDINIQRHVDIQVLISQGSFHLKEFSENDSLMLKTHNSVQIITTNQIESELSFK